MVIIIALSNWVKLSEAHTEKVKEELEADKESRTDKESTTTEKTSEEKGDALQQVKSEPSTTRNTKDSESSEAAVSVQEVSEKTQSETEKLGESVKL